MQVTIENGFLVIKAPLESPPQPSSTGKTLLVANSHGYTRTTATVNGKPVSVSLTATIPNK